MCCGNVIDKYKKEGGIFIKGEVLIFSYKIAKDLIKSGFVVKDIRPNHKVDNATIVVFEENEGIKSYLKEKWNIRS